MAVPMMPAGAEEQAIMHTCFLICGRLMVFVIGHCTASQPVNKCSDQSHRFWTFLPKANLLVPTLSFKNQYFHYFS
jgi:hypothetical protein